MKKILILLGLLGLCCISSFAQDYNRYNNSQYDEDDYSISFQTEYDVTRYLSTHTFVSSDKKHTIKIAQGGLVLDGVYNQGLVKVVSMTSTTANIKLTVYNNSDPYAIAGGYNKQETFIYLNAKKGYMKDGAGDYYYLKR